VVCLNFLLVGGELEIPSGLQLRFDAISTLIVKGSRTGKTFSGASVLGPRTRKAERFMKRIGPRALKFHVSKKTPITGSGECSNLRVRRVTEVTQVEWLSRSTLLTMTTAVFALGNVIVSPPFLFGILLSAFLLKTRPIAISLRG